MDGQEANPLLQVSQLQQEGDALPQEPHPTSASSNSGVDTQRDGKSQGGSGRVVYGPQPHSALATLCVFILREYLFWHVVGYLLWAIEKSARQGEA